MIGPATSAALATLSHTGLVVGGCNMVGYAITAILETHKITDLVGAGSFVAATVSLSLKNNLFTTPVASPKLLLVNLGVILWGVRLASFLFYRVLQVGSDKRLNKFFRKPGEGYLDLKQSIFPLRLGIFWTIQSAWGFLCLIPVALLNSIPQTHADGTPNPLLQLGGGSPVQTAVALLPVVGVFLGILLESVADFQKNSYRNDKRNDGHWCDVGLWKLSRYPNYFGEMLTWWSLYFAALPALLSTAPPAMIPFAPALALVSPAFITFLLMKVSGIPLLEKKYTQQYAGNEEFQRYVRDTPLLLPNPLLALRSSSKKRA